MFRILFKKRCVATCDTRSEAEAWVASDLHFMLTSEINPQTRAADYLIQQEG